MNPLATLLTNPIALIVLFTLGYALTCAIWPFKRCRRCNGTGHLQSSFMRAHRTCGYCEGSGQKLRFGRIVHNAWTRNRR